MGMEPKKCSTRTPESFISGEIFVVLSTSGIVINTPFNHDKEDHHASLHRHDNGNFYPGTGGSTECGANVGLGTNINIAWSGDYLSANDCVNCSDNAMW